MAVYPPGKPKRYDPIRKKGDLPPHAPGEYRITTRFLGRILYIGETADLQRRMGEHLRTGKIREALRHPFRRSCWFEYKVAHTSASPKARRQHEREKIRRHHPPLNRSNWGEGRTAKESRT